MERKWVAAGDLSRIWPWMRVSRVGSLKVLPSVQIRAHNTALYISQVREGSWNSTLNRSPMTTYRGNRIPTIGCRHLFWCVSPCCGSVTLALDGCGIPPSDQHWNPRPPGNLQTSYGTDRILPLIRGIQSHNASRRIRRIVR